MALEVVGKTSKVCRKFESKADKTVFISKGTPTPINTNKRTLFSAKYDPNLLKLLFVQHIIVHH